MSEHFVVCKYWEDRRPWLSASIDLQRTECTVCRLDLVIASENLELGKPICIGCFLAGGGMIEATGFARGGRMFRNMGQAAADVIRRIRARRQ